MKKLFRFAFYFVCISSMLTQTAYAYLDPATTTYIWQAVCGIVIAIGTAVGIYWHKIKKAFKKNKEEPEKLNLADENDTNSGKTVITAADLLDDEDDKD
ncbi:MAG: hypothetical protein IJ737_06150 [Ruminococcus sp.]|nr:hypothetical protein [Ruminococcus sp.]